MSHSSKNALRIAYFVDTFPCRTENFILREIAGALTFWPEIRVYSFREAPENWKYVDCAEVAQRVRHRSIRLSLLDLTLAYASWISGHPIRFVRCFLRSLQIHGAMVHCALRRMNEAVALAQIARSDGVEHFHAHFLAETAIVCCLAAGLTGISFSVSVHANDIWGRKPPLRVLDNAVCCVACTMQAKRFIERARPGINVECIRHGLPKTGFLLDPVPESPAMPPVRLISAGRFVAKKGFEVLIRACALLSKEGLDYQCEIVGEGPLEESLRCLVSDLSLNDRVRILPFCSFPELAREIEQAHLFIMASQTDTETGDRDGMPNVILEAMKCGTIVIASKTPTIEEVLVDRKNSFLFEMGDPSALTRTIQIALASQTDWPKVRREALRVLSEEFSDRRNIQSLCSAIERTRAREC